MSLSDFTSGHRPLSKSDDTVWRTTAPAGIHAVGVDFADRAYSCVSPQPRAFYPPGLEHTVAVERAR